MASRNILRFDAPDRYYHVYLRGVNKAIVFNDSQDKDYFLYLLSRHLSKEPVYSKMGYKYPHYRGRVELLAYCLMDNHFHMLFYQHEKGSVTEIMHSILIAYVAYFNRRYERTGPLFESRFRAAYIDDDAYLLHISRYIHLNPRSWKYYKHSSIIHFRKGTEPEWLQTGKVLNLHKSRRSYIQFVSDYSSHKKMLDEIKHQLADK